MKIRSPKARDLMILAGVVGVIGVFGLMDDGGVRAEEVAAPSDEGVSERIQSPEPTVTPMVTPPAPPPSNGITRLRSRMVIDNTGFGQPVEAVSVLVPDGWAFESRVVWAGENGFCSGDYAGVFWSMTSPDGDYMIETRPALLISDQLDTFQSRGMDPRGGHCLLGSVQSARDLAERMLIPVLRPANRIIELGELSEVPEALQEQAAVQAQSVALVGGRVGVAGTAIMTRTPNDRHDEAIVLFHVEMEFPSPGFGVPGQSFTITTPPFILRAPADEIDKLVPLAATIGETVRFNPGWQRAIQQLDSNITRAMVQGAAERSQILANSAREVGEIQMSSWQNRMDANWRGTQQFSSAIMGVDQRVDPFTGETVALDGAGRRFFANSTGEYLIVDAPDIDPRTLFPSESWQEMESATAVP